MHFRVRGNNVQIVKTVDDPATGRAVSKPVGSANLASGVVGPRVREALSPQELAEVEAWLARQRDLAARRLELDFQFLPQTLGTIAAWVQTASEEQVEPYREEVLGAMQRLRFRLSRRPASAA